MSAVMEAARPIPARDRGEFLRDVSAEFQKNPELGVGIVGRVVAMVRRQHLAPAAGTWAVSEARRQNQSLSGFLLIHRPSTKSADSFWHSLDLRCAQGNIHLGREGHLMRKRISNVDLCWIVVDQHDLATGR